ncbi:voltage-gated hydrogen channel 1-like [Rana temporaria]|uniref:voltage-gated hydrogen channel 1-like n=1 Tax=Rana temporaria TaxID=8407 RepID=UPI001AAC7C4C|nr:voltage-gated hydrogen channel 1-like [Rana temporaria]
MAQVPGYSTRLAGLFPRMSEFHSGFNIEDCELDMEAVDDVEDEDSEEQPEQPEQPEPHQCRSSFKDGLKWLFSSPKYNMLILALVLIDVGLVIGELILEKRHHNIKQIFHYFSMTIMSLFIVELAFKLLAFQLVLFSKWYELLDMVVVGLTFALDIIHLTKEPTHEAQLLILFRLWNVARIVNGK